MILELAATPSEGIWLAVISVIGGIITLTVKHMLDQHAIRIDETQADLAAMKVVMGDVITWAFALESHISEGKPPPPPARPPALIEFFTTSFIERSRTSEPSPLRRGFFTFLKKEKLHES